MTNLNDLLAYLERHAQEHVSPYSYRILRLEKIEPDERLDDLPNGTEYVEVRAFSAGGHTIKPTDANGRYLDGTVPTPPSQLVIGGQPIENQLGSIRDAIRAEERLIARRELEDERKRLKEEREQVAVEVVEEIVAENEDQSAGDPEPVPPTEEPRVEIHPRGRIGRIFLGERA